MSDFKEGDEIRVMLSDTGGHMAFPQKRKRPFAEVLDLLEQGYDPEDID